MSKTLQALNSSESFPQKELSKETGFSSLTAVLWVTASILATVFSYQLGIQQGKEEAVEASSPKEWVYYFNEEEEIVASAQQSEKMTSVPKSPKSEAPTVGKPASRKGGFAIQLVTYESLKLAEQEAARLKQKGEDAFVISSGKYYLVCMNLSKDRKAVEQKLTQLTKQGYSKVYPGAYVRRFKE